MRRAEPGYNPRIVAKFRDNIGLPYDDRVARQLEERGIGPWRRLVEQFPGIAIRPLFGSVEPGRIRQLIAEAERWDRNYRPPDFFAYYAIDLRVEVEVDAVIQELLQWESVTTAYFDPPGEEPQTVFANDPGLRNPGYLDAAPDGIDARCAWEYQGGKGAGQEVVDLERGWLLNHVDIAGSGIAQVCGDNIGSARPHGTSVLGVICAAHRQQIGCLGIAPDVGTARVISHFGKCNGAPASIADAIMKIANSLPVGSGAVLLLEVQHSGIPVEYLLAIFEAIEFAVARGIVVIEPAGNGGMNGVDLDNFTDLKGNRVLNRNFRDSGAIMVAAAQSGVIATAASNTHARASSSNYGNRVDCYAWGEKVPAPTSAASAPFSVIDAYRLDFNGTSSASAIIAGAALVVQGMAQASGHGRLSPSEMRSLLSDKSFGTGSSDPVNFPIGVMPDLQRIIDSGRIGAVPKLSR